jgi:biopolymer transport protein ExbB
MSSTGWMSGVIGQATGAAPGPESVFDFVMRGGPVMVPIALCSLIALAVIVERALKLTRRQVIPAGFLDGLRGVLKDPSRDRDAALRYCGEHPGPVGRVLTVGIRRLGEPEEALERHIQEAGEREVPELRKRLRLLSVIAAVAPLLGLLGTILGMITAFKTVAASGEALGRTELLAKGIYEAMVTTAAGLVVAIPTLLFYHWLSARVEQLVAEVDRMTVEFIEEFGRGDLAGRADGAERVAATEPEPLLAGS